MTWVEITYVFLCIIFAYIMKYFLEKGMVMKRLIIGCPMLQTTYNPANGRSQGAIFESKVNLNNNIVNMSVEYSNLEEIIDEFYMAFSVGVNHTLILSSDWVQMLQLEIQGQKNILKLKMIIQRALLSREMERE